jgi:predicted DNA-binding transcriptional regulator AlpA
MTGDDWIHPKEAAARCGVSTMTFWRWRRNNYGPPFFRLHRRIRYRASEVDRWLEAQRGK